MFACTSGLLLAILVAVTPAEVSSDSVKIVTKDENGNLIPHVRLKINGADPLTITTDDQAEAIIPFNGKRITVRIDPSQPDSKDWRTETFEIPKQEVTLTIKKARLKHPAPPSVGYAKPPYSDSCGYWVLQQTIRYMSET